MQHLRVINLKALAKSKGLRGYSKLRKAELINLLTDDGVKMKPEVIFIEEPEVIFVEESEVVNQPNSKQSLEEEEEKRKKMSRREKRKAKKKKREAEKKSREAEKKKKYAEERKRVVEKRKKKRESKKRNKKNRSAEKLNSMSENTSVDIDQLVKDVEEEQAEQRRSEEKDRAFDVERVIKRLKKKLRKTKGKKKRSLQKEIQRLRHHSSSFELVESESALNHFTTQYTIDGREGYGPKQYLMAVKPTILTFLRENPSIKILLCLHCIMSKTDLKTGEVLYTDAYFYSNTEINFQGTDVSDLYKTMMNKMLESLATYQQRGSNWVFDSVEELSLFTVEYEPLSGSSYIPLPKNLADKKAIINMKNDDNECFKWCITRALNPVARDSERITKILRLQAEKLNWKDLKFPMETKDISRFEKLNEISINVYGYDKDAVYPLSVSKAGHSTSVNLLFISKDEKKHYCLIKSMSRLLSSQTSTKEHKKFYCPRCLNSFGRQDLLDKHLELCQDNEAVRIKMPEEGTFVEFKNYHKQMDMPFVIYADFESRMIPIHSTQQNPKQSYTEKKMLHVPVSFCYFVKCSFDDKFSKKVEYTATSEEEDVAQIFVKKLEEEVKSIYKEHPKKMMIFTEEDNDNYEKSDSCWLRGKAFTPRGMNCSEKDWKVRDHCHYTGKYRGAAHNSCNIQFRRPKFTPVIFHNLAGYDAHLFIKNLGVSEGNIDCIPNNEEKYISFTKHVEVDRFTPKGEEKEVIVKRELRFIDSMKFMNSSLDRLVSNLAGLNDVKCTANNECKEDNKEMTFLYIDIKYVAHFKCMKCGVEKTKALNKEEIQRKFKNTYNVYINKDKLFRSLLRKGVYPYEWLDSVERLNETQLPSKDVFYSKLTGQEISDVDYEHAQTVWRTFRMKTMRDYHNLYNQSDVLLLADVFENFREVCKENYNLDPCWYYTVPGLAWDACLKLTKQRLELLSDPDMLLFFEKGIRGGISTISTRHGQANNKYMGDKFDVTKRLTVFRETKRNETKRND